MDDTVDILLATYCGGTYLTEQLASLERQTHPRWRLLIRDDGSTDDSLALLENFQQRHPNHVHLLIGGTRGGASANFSALLEASTAPYVMCCDQDDVWDNDKVALSLLEMQALERQHGTEAPLLVHTDLRVADASLRIVDTSFWHYSKLYPQQTTSLNRLLVQNVVTGCASLCNRSLLDVALPIPTSAIMHDWWLALVAGTFGYISALPRATITYRQHSSNVVGAQQFGTWQWLQRARRQLGALSSKKHAQASTFLQHYLQRLNQPQRAILEAYLSLSERGFFSSRYLSLRHGFRKQGALRQLAALLLLKQP